MAQDPTERMPEPKMDGEALYREDIFTDRKVGTIRTLNPVKSDGSADTGRPVIYMGETQILTGMGALPVNFEIDAKNLKEAIEKFGAAAKEGIERTVKELQDLRRQAASSIVVPQSGMGPGGGMGGIGGGGKIQLP